MDTDVLVDQKFEEGLQLVTQLRQSNFDVTVAFWAKTGDDERWSLYIASKVVDEKGIALAYGEAYSILHSIEPTWLTMWEVKLLSSTDPSARDAVAVRERHKGRTPRRYPGPTLGRLAVEEAYIYPAASAPMTPRELLQTLFAMANRPVGTEVRPSLITLRDGSSKQGIISGFHLQMPGGLTIDVLDPDNKTKSQIPGAGIAVIE